MRVHSLYATSSSTWLGVHARVDQLKAGYAAARHVNARQAWGLPAEEVSFLQADADVALDVAPAAVHGEVGLEGLVAEEAVARCLAEDELVHDGSRLGRVHDRHGE